MESIKPKTKKEEYVLEDKDYLLIKALQELTKQIRRSASGI